MSETTLQVLTCGDLREGALEAMLARWGLELVVQPLGAPIPGSYWAPPEAGIVGLQLHVRPDTPVHSALHEACHTLCMDPDRRATLHTDAGGDDLEESGVCYLQILLADHLPGVGRDRLMADMDAWGYSFRLGSTRAWFEEDAEDAHRWVLEHELILPGGTPTWRPRGGS